MQYGLKAYMNLSGKSQIQMSKQEEISLYISHRTKNKDDWPAKQAQVAIRLFLYFRNQSSKTPATADNNIKTQ